MKKLLNMVWLMIMPVFPLLAAETFSAEQVKQGAYLARIGDCVACHTAADGKMFAGGLSIGSPIGTIYSTNITPDKVNGIGNYSFEEFDNAVRHGIGKNYTLYPAMPYPSYARLTDEDTQALYAYFMQNVPAINKVNQETGIIWPLSMRWPLNVWRWIFAPEVVAFVANGDPQVARGAYLVEGLGHCGACHTPRGIGLQEKALSNQDSNRYLSGGDVMNGWKPSSLRGDYRQGLGDWSEAQIVEFLRTGRTDHATVFGSMKDVVVDSMQYMTDDDLTAIAKYLKTLSANNKQQQPFKYDDTVAKALFNGDDGAKGAAIYVDSCAACHRTDGKGQAKVFPALAGNSALGSDDATSIIHIILKGDTLPSTLTAPTPFTMPPFDWRLNDQDVAEVVNFIRTSWGNQAKAVSANDVADVRKEVGAMAKGMPVNPEFVE